MDTDVPRLSSTLPDARCSKGSPGVPGRPSKVDCLARRFLTELVGCGCVPDTSLVITLYLLRAAGALLMAPGEPRRFLTMVFFLAGCSSYSGDGDVRPNLASRPMASVQAGILGVVVGFGAAPPTPLSAPGRICSVSAGLRGALLRLGVGLRMMIHE